VYAVILRRIFQCFEAVTSLCAVVISVEFALLVRKTRVSRVHPWQNVADLITGLASSHFAERR
jgi:hypothetical protein